MSGNRKSVSSCMQNIDSFGTESDQQRRISLATDSSASERFRDRTSPPSSGTEQLSSPFLENKLLNNGGAAAACTSASRDPNRQSPTKQTTTTAPLGFAVSELNGDSAIEEDPEISVKEAEQLSASLRSDSAFLSKFPPLKAKARDPEGNTAVARQLAQDVDVVLAAKDDSGAEGESVSLSMHTAPNKMRVWNEILSKRFAAALETPPKTLCLESAAKPIDGAKECTITVSTGLKKSQTVGIYRMESVKPLPPMSAWVYTPRNYAWIMSYKTECEKSEVMPNIDGPSTISTSRERACRTYASLFCRRCYVPGCNLHGLPANPSRRRKKPDPPGNESEEIPCGPNCYKHEDLYCVLSLPNKPPFVERSNIKVEKAESEPARGASVLGKDSRSSLPGWSPKEETMFHVYRGAFGDNFCDIAECLGNKNCRQVRDFAMMEGSEVDESTLSPPLPTGSKKSSSQDHYHRFQVKKCAGSDAGTVRYPYNPCDHPPGFMCSEGNCECAAKNNYCMKFCNCSSSCLNRFRGCRCRAHCNTSHCSCFMAMRECDPDLCTSCGAGDFDNEEINCTNVAIQRHWKKHLLLAPSDVAGWGVFLKDAVKKGELISEYCGELLSHDEAERRGKVYDRLKCSYLFSLNAEQEVDATRIGNKIRFANHSTNPNCASKVMMVNGDHRIGIYAQEDIDEGEELFFDYRYGTEDKLKFVSIERPKKD